MKNLSDFNHQGFLLHLVHPSQCCVFSWIMEMTKCLISFRKEKLIRVEGLKATRLMWKNKARDSESGNTLFYVLMFFQEHVFFLQYVQLPPLPPAWKFLWNVSNIGRCNCEKRGNGTVQNAFNVITSPDLNLLLNGNQPRARNISVFS